MTDAAAASPQRDSSRAWKIAGVSATLAIVLSIPLYAVRENVLGAGNSAGQSGAASEVAFVGRERCAECHDEAYEAWLGSDHDMAMAEADSTTVLGDFDDAVLEHGGATHRFFRRDAGYWVHTEGPDGEMGDFEVAYTFGHEPLQQYLIPFPGGRLQSLTIAWDTEREEWFPLYPDQDIPWDDWLHWTRNGQNWNGMCAECHSTNLRKGYNPATGTFNTTWSEIDVSCEACHGPGSRHVEWAELPDMARPEVENYDLVIPTSGITSKQQVELCAPCHSRRTELGDYDHTELDLLDHLIPAVLERGYYFADGQILEEVYVYGSFVQSKMYRNDVRCGDCHDVHGLELLKEGNELCLQCHRADTYDSYDHHFHEPETSDGLPNEGTECVKCHMPERPYMVVDWRADHSIRVPRPDLTLDIGTPNSCEQSGCHDDKPTTRSADYFTKWYGQARRSHFGRTLEAGRSLDPGARDELIRLAGDALYPDIVRATALSLLSAYPGEESTRAFNAALQAEDPLIRYTAAQHATAATPEELIDLVAPLLFDAVKAVRGQAAVRLAPLPREMLKPYQRDALEEAIEEYKRTMEYSLDFPFAGHNLGNLYAALAEPARAEEYYRVALGIDDLFMPAKMNLAVLYNSQGRNDEAETLLREVLEDYPENGEAAYSLGLLLVEMGRPGEALAYLEQAADRLPQRTRIRYNLGLLWQQLGRMDEAETALRAALEAEPDNLEYMFALADHYLKRGDLRRADALADRIIETHPAAPVGPQIKAYIEGQVRQ
jgi:tetratricopeptide (TPR) repeat protein